MHSAASGGNVEVIDILKDADAKLLSTEDCRQKTPLHLAAKYGKLEAVEHLMCAFDGQPTDEIDFMDEAIESGHKYDACSMHTIIL